MPPPPLDGWLSPFFSSPPAHSSCPAPQSQLAVPVSPGPCELPEPRLPMPGLFCPSALAPGWVKGYSGAQPPGEWEALLGFKSGEGPLPSPPLPKPSPYLLPSIPPEWILPQGSENWLWLICIFSKISLCSDPQTKAAGNSKLVI